MKTGLRTLGPNEAWEDAVRRSCAVGAAGFLIGGSLQAAAAIPEIYRVSLVLSGIVAFFLTALTFFIAYYHRQWRLGAVGTIAALSLPCLANTLWVRLTAWSLLYPAVVVVLLGLCSLQMLHRKLSGPNWDGEIDGEQIRTLMAAFESGVTFTWMDRVILLWCVAVAVLLLILFLR